MPKSSKWYPSASWFFSLYSALGPIWYIFSISKNGFRQVYEFLVRGMFQFIKKLEQWKNSHFTYFLFYVISRPGFRFYPIHEYQKFEVNFINYREIKRNTTLLCWNWVQKTILIYIRVFSLIHRPLFQFFVARKALIG